MSIEFERFVVTASGHFLTELFPFDYSEMEEDDLMRFIAESVCENFEHLTNEQVFVEILYLAEAFEEIYQEGYDAGLDAINS